MTQVLVPGGAVRIFTPGGDLVSQVDSGQGPELKVTHLQPGNYVALQEQVHEDGVTSVALEFTVDAGAEFAVLPVGGVPDGETARERRARKAAQK